MESYQPRKGSLDMAYKKFSVSLPAELYEQAEAVRKAEHRTRSELVREALRLYIDRFRRIPVVQPTSQDARMLKEGWSAYRSGDYVTLEELHHEMAGSHQ